MPLWRHASREPLPRGLRLAFTTRRGGVSAPPYDTLNLGRSTSDRPEAVEENRHRVLSALGFDPARLATMGQVHGATIARVDRPGLFTQCDGAVTTTRGVAIAATGADCLPILFVQGDAVGAAHAGWRGVVAGVAEATLAAACEAAALPADRARAHLGPCIRGCCYEVGPDVASQFPHEALRRSERGVRLDLPTAVCMRLVAAGMPREAIEDTGACTACEPSRYFSHRRDRGTTGRQWGVIGWENATS